MFLDPVKLLVIGVVALMVLGPDHLPRLARSAGSLWHEFQGLRARLDQHVHDAFPDLPATHEIAAAVRSPIVLLDRLAKEAVAPAPTSEAPSASDAQAPVTKATATTESALPDPCDERAASGSASASGAHAVNPVALTPGHAGDSSFASAPRAETQPAVLGELGAADAAPMN
jgi:Sec-independent protein translocase protein TatA